MRHLQLSKHLYRNQSSIPAVSGVQLSVGAASHTLIVRRLQLATLTKVLPKILYSQESERDAIYPSLSYSKSAAPKGIATVVNAVQNLADNNTVQLVQPTAIKDGCHLRLVRCGLTNKMRSLNERLPDFDFDPFTLNGRVNMSASSSVKQEALLRFSGLPVRLSRTIK